MKPLNFKTVSVAILLALIFSINARSQSNENGADTREKVVNGNPGSYKYKQRIDNRMRGWQRLMPRLFTLQFAGDIGMFSAGIGWHYGKSKQWETHALFGYLPPRQNYSHYWTFSLREIYNPWKIKIGEQCSVTPFSVNLSINSILHGDFWMSEPDRYPNGYYGFSSRMRFHLGFGQRLSFNIPENKRYFHSKISVYYEVSTCDLYVRQKFLNSAIPFKDIIALGVGIIYTL